MSAIGTLWKHQKVLNLFSLQSLLENIRVKISTKTHSTGNYEYESCL